MAELDDPASKPKYSKQSLKRLHNLNSVALKQITNGQERRLSDVCSDLEKARREIALLNARLLSAAQLMEAVVRRHGVQTFDRQTVQSICKRGWVEFDLTDDRIAVRLRSEPTELLDGKVS